MRQTHHSDKKEYQVALDHSPEFCLMFLMNVYHKGTGHTPGSQVFQQIQFVLAILVEDRLFEHFCPIVFKFDQPFQSRRFLKLPKPQ